MQCIPNCILSCISTESSMMFWKNLQVYQKVSKKVVAETRSAYKSTMVETANIAVQKYGTDKFSRKIGDVKRAHIGVKKCFARI